MKRTSLVLAAVLATFASAACTKSEGGASDEKLKALSARIDKLEASQKGFADIEAFLRPIMAEQQAKMDEQAANEPDPDARFSVDVSGSAYEGPEGAAVTIVEAFDFA